MLLSVKNLSTHFNAGAGKVASDVDVVSFNLEQGKTLALVGESGCGKTQTAFSIIKLIAETAIILQETFFLKTENCPNLIRKRCGYYVAMILP